MLTREQKIERRSQWRLILADDPDWRLRAECKKYQDPPNAKSDEKLWHCDKPDVMPERAREICNVECPVRDACEANYMLNESQDSRIGNGMGMTPKERRSFYRSGLVPNAEPAKPAAKIPKVTKEKVTLPKWTGRGIKRAPQRPRLYFDDFQAMENGEPVSEEVAEAIQRLIDKGVLHKAQ